MDTPIFTRTFDLLAWVIPMTNHFPKSLRHSFTQRLLDAAFDLRERLEEANMRRGLQRRERLTAADEALAKTRLYLRLAYRFGWMTERQYLHVAKMEVEVGRLLGAWIKGTSTSK